MLEALGIPRASSMVVVLVVMLMIVLVGGRAGGWSRCWAVVLEVA